MGTGLAGAEDTSAVRRDAGAAASRCLEVPVGHRRRGEAAVGPGGAQAESGRTGCIGTNAGRLVPVGPLVGEPGVGRRTGRLSVGCRSACPSASRWGRPPASAAGRPGNDGPRPAGGSAASRCRRRPHPLTATTATAAATAARVPITMVRKDFPSVAATGRVGAALGRHRVEGLQVGLLGGQLAVARGSAQGGDQVGDSGRPCLDRAAGSASSRSTSQGSSGSSCSLWSLGSSFIGRRTPVAPRSVTAAPPRWLRGQRGGFGGRRTGRQPCASDFEAAMHRDPHRARSCARSAPPPGPRPGPTTTRSRTISATAGGSVATRSRAARVEMRLQCLVRRIRSRCADRSGTASKSSSPRRPAAGRCRSPCCGR